MVSEGAQRSARQWSRIAHGAQNCPSESSCVPMAKQCRPTAVERPLQLGTRKSVAPTSLEQTLLGGHDTTLLAYSRCTWRSLPRSDAENGAEATGSLSPALSPLAGLLGKRRGLAGALKYVTAVAVGRTHFSARCFGDYNAFRRGPRCPPHLDSPTYLITVPLSAPSPHSRSLQDRAKSPADDRTPIRDPDTVSCRRNWRGNANGTTSCDSAGRSRPAGFRTRYRIPGGRVCAWCREYSLGHRSDPRVEVIQMLMAPTARFITAAGWCPHCGRG
jgi:hypothetical protein